MERKRKYVKITNLEITDWEVIEWYAIDTSNRKARKLANRMGMPAMDRVYEYIYLTDEQFERIPEWRA